MEGAFDGLRRPVSASAACGVWRMAAARHGLRPHVTPARPCVCVFSRHVSKPLFPRPHCSPRSMDPSHTFSLSLSALLAFSLYLSTYPADVFSFSFPLHVKPTARRDDSAGLHSPSVGFLQEQSSTAEHISSLFTATRFIIPLKCCSVHQIW